MWAQVFESVGVHEKPDLPEAFHERRTHEFGGESTLPDKRIEFGIGQWCNFALSQFPQHCHPTLSLYKFVHITIPIFSKSGGYELP